MLRAAAKIFVTFIFFTFVCIVAKVAFMLVHLDLLELQSIVDACTVIYHGLSMDMSVAGYLSALPALLITAAVCTSHRWPRICLRIYIIVAALLLSTIFTLDTVLYGYWGSKLDTTPIFYLTTSPAAAMASVTGLQCVALIVVVAVVTALIYLLYQCTAGRIEVTATKRGRDVAACIFFTALLFIPIRGSLTVSTMNPSRAYFSPRPSLNHAALNPAFNLLYSATHTAGYARRYRFIPEEQAAARFAEMTHTATAAESASDSIPLLRSRRPEIVLIILESFSSYLFPSLGGDSVATGLDSIARSGLLFSNIYASGNRTDRALPAILSALPSQPGESVLKYPAKIERLPSLASTLGRHSYESAYFYGGDANFTNMQAYLMNMGMSHTVSDRDFALSEKASKWGAPDHLVLARAAEYLLHPGATQDSTHRRFTVIQTSSSHEPFDVPYHNPKFEKGSALNAFAYTDSCVTDFINALRRSELWEDMLVVLVPDHYGCWPRQLPDMPSRYHIPLLMTGGALGHHGSNNTLGSQTDITASILTAMDISTDEFPFSANLLERPAGLPVYMAAPGMVAIVTQDGHLTWNCDADAVEESTGNDDFTRRTHTDAQTYLQVLYRYLSDL